MSFTDADIDALLTQALADDQPWDLDVIIEGKSITKGSGQARIAKPKGKPAYAFFVPDNPADQKRWSAIVAGIVRPHWIDGDGRPREPAPKGTPITLEGHFVLPRRPNTPFPTPPHTEPPDWDKLARCLCDPLTGIVYADDSQINEPYCPKRYAEPGEEPHVWLRVRVGEP